MIVSRLLACFDLFRPFHRQRQEQRLDVEVLGHDIDADDRDVLGS